MDSSLSFIPIFFHGLRGCEDSGGMVPYGTYFKVGAQATVTLGIGLDPTREKVQPSICSSTLQTSCFKLIIQTH